MGLGGAARGATTVYALVILAILVVVGLVLVLLTRWLARRWRPAAGVAVGYVLLLLAAPSYFSAESHAERRAASARDRVLSLAGQSVGQGNLAVHTDSWPCPQGGAFKGRVAYEYGLASGPDVLERFSTALGGLDFEVTRGRATSPAEDFVRGTRGGTSVYVGRADVDQTTFFIRALDDGACDER